MKEQSATVHLRHDQHQLDSDRRKDAQDDKVVAVADDWVEEELNKLAVELKGAEVTIIGNGYVEGPDAKPLRKFKLGETISLPEFLMLARNEPMNITGEINESNYKGIHFDIIWWLKILVKFPVIVGRDQATHRGGYGSGRKEYSQPLPVIVVDLSALQAQEHYNSMCLALVTEEKSAFRQREGEAPHSGAFSRAVLEETLYKRLMGHSRPTIAAAKAQPEKFREIAIGEETVYFDTAFYQEVVARDFLTAIFAIGNYVGDSDEKIWFKFLAYGTGYFADLFKQSGLKAELPFYLLQGVFLGLVWAFKMGMPKSIKAIEFPFLLASSLTSEMKELRDRVISLCQANKIECVFSKDDALQERSGYTLALTNTSDPHAPMGNEIDNVERPKSLDPAIAGNIIGRGDKFGPQLNQAMGQHYLKLSTPPNKSEIVGKIIKAAETKEAREAKANAAADAELYPSVMLFRIATGELVVRFHSVKERDQFLQSFTPEIKLSASHQKASKYNRGNNPQAQVPYTMPGNEHCLFFPTYEAKNKETAVNLESKSNRDAFLKLLELTASEPPEPLENGQTKLTYFSGLITAFDGRKKKDGTHQEGAIYFKPLAPLVRMAEDKNSKPDCLLLYRGSQNKLVSFPISTTDRESIAKNGKDLPLAVVAGHPKCKPSSTFSKFLNRDPNAAEMNYTAAEETEWAKRRAGERGDYLLKWAHFTRQRAYNQDMAMPLSGYIHELMQKSNIPVTSSAPGPIETSPPASSSSELPTAAPAEAVPAPASIAFGPSPPWVALAQGPAPRTPVSSNSARFDYVDPTARKPAAQSDAPAPG